MTSQTESVASTWFNAALGRISLDNYVTFYVNGVDAFSAVADALVSPDLDENSYVLLLGWSCQIDFPLKARDPKSTLRELLKTVDSRKASVRAMLWNNWTAHSLIIF